MKTYLKITSIVFVVMLTVGLFLFRSQKRKEEINNMIIGDVPEIDKSSPDEIETATFSMGCFWGPDGKFGALEGVVRTRVGYAGGDKENPTYHNLGKHTETIQIDYDPDKITYSQLLDVFWNSHKPTIKMNTQYMSRIFYHDERQERIAKGSRDQLEKKMNDEIKTVISQFKKFYPAEDYHQKYYLKQHKDFFEIYKKIYPNGGDFMRSTAVSRANGYVVGDGYLESPEDLIGMGLTEEGRQKLFDDWMDAQNYHGKSCSTPYL